MREQGKLDSVKQCYIEVVNVNVHSVFAVNKCEFDLHF